MFLTDLPREVLPETWTGSHLQLSG
jgi:DNA-binding transcriptional regulator PaaX